VWRGRSARRRRLAFFAVGIRAPDGRGGLSPWKPLLRCVARGRRGRFRVSSCSSRGGQSASRAFSGRATAYHDEPGGPIRLGGIGCARVRVPRCGGSTLWRLWGDDVRRADRFSSQIHGHIESRAARVLRGGPGRSFVFSSPSRSGFSPVDGGPGRGIQETNLFYLRPCCIHRRSSPGSEAGGQPRDLQPAGPAGSRGDGGFVLRAAGSRNPAVSFG